MIQSLLQQTRKMKAGERGRRGSRFKQQPSFFSLFQIADEGEDDRLEGGEVLDDIFIPFSLSGEL